MKANGKKITVFLSEDLHKSARVKIAEINTSFQQVLITLLGEWATGKRQAAIPPPAPRSIQPDKYGEDMERLQFIMENGTPQQKEWIRGNLKTFVQAIHGHPNATPFRKRASG